ncbi:MAG: glycosyltransferase family 39 protein [Candidatus Hatepunaea meridiana]|nr:glycosyltransferase family 39 protein [Candidatus Hatepunaea meridiana]
MTFIILIGLGSFKFHLIGDWDVETDFYWDYAPAAEKLIHGEIDISHYRFRGPGYPLLLVPLIILLKDSFLAARILALIAAAITLWFAYRISSKTINPVWGVWIVAALALNQHFAEYSFRVGTDMPFMALCMVVCYLFTVPRFRGLEILLGVVCGYACLTRYNGIALVVISVLWVLLSDRRSDSKTWFGRLGFLVIGLGPVILPWMLILYLKTGNPFYNQNSLNILYGLQDADKITWDQFWYSNSVNGSGSLITGVLQNPLRLILTFANNFITHFPEDMSKLVNWKLGWCVVGGIIWISFRRFRIEKLGWTLAAGFIIYAFLSLVFYNIRFSLPLLPIYLLLACYFLSSIRISLEKKWLKWEYESVLMIAFIIIITGTPVRTRDIIYKMRR